MSMYNEGMARYNYRQVPYKERKVMTEQLAETLVSLKKKEKVAYFLQRLLTESELVMLSRRIKVAELLVAGLTYEQIMKKLNVGVSTIINVDRWLTDATHEYHLVREETRKEKQEKERLKRQKQRSTGPSLLDHPNVPDNIKMLIRYDSRMILIKLLLGDF